MNSKLVALMKIFNSRQHLHQEGTATENHIAQSTI